MTSKEYFVVGIRLFGLWELLRAVDYAVECFDRLAGYFEARTTTVGADLTHGLTFLVLGLFLLGNAPQIAGFFQADPRPAGTVPPPISPSPGP